MDWRQEHTPSNAFLIHLYERSLRQNHLATHLEARGRCAVSGFFAVTPKGTERIVLTLVVTSSPAVPIVTCEATFQMRALWVPLYFLQRQGQAIELEFINRSESPSGRWKNQRVRAARRGASTPLRCTRCPAMLHGPLNGQRSVKPSARTCRRDVLRRRVGCAGELQGVL